MPLIEDYGIIGDTHTAALVSKSGSIDWLCLPRFDSPACFAGLLGNERQGHWQITPAGRISAIRRSYQGDSLILETEFHTPDGTVRLVDCMPPRQRDPGVARVVEGVRGRVPMRMELVIRFDYGSIVPWVQRVDGALHAIAGPDSVWLRTPVELRGENLSTVADFTVSEGERVPFMLTWHASHMPAPPVIDPIRAIDETEAWWGEWASRITYRGLWEDAVIRSLLVLKALTYEPTGGIVAAPTTSLPEAIGGIRNWDYRYC
ncbi:MAG TPA: trehalase-like domain-containing protein, partial [Actinomycetes bacterium]|nr:trehalase-like domain-containing protein [Actinomycetes bacterium]